MVVYPIIYRVSYTIPGGCLRFQPSTVVNGLFHPLFGGHLTIPKRSQRIARYQIFGESLIPRSLLLSVDERYGFCISSRNLFLPRKVSLKSWNGTNATNVAFWRFGDLLRV